MKPIDYYLIFFTFLSDFNFNLFAIILFLEILLNLSGICNKLCHKSIYILHRFVVPILVHIYYRKLDFPLIAK